MEAALLLVAVIVGLFVQVVLIALGVYWGTATLRRDLFEFRQQSLYLHGD